MTGYGDMDLWATGEINTYLGEHDLVKTTRHDGQPVPPAAPEYIVRPPDSEIQILLYLKDADFGEAFFSTGQSIPKHLDMPVWFMPIWFAAPEVLFLDPVGPPSEIWTLACILYRIISGCQLFRSFDGDQDEVLVDMACSLRNLPDCWWRRREKRSDAMFQLESSGLTGDTKTNLQARLQIICTLLELEEIAFEEMVRGMLRFESSERIAAEEVQLLPSSWNVLV